MDTVPGKKNDRMWGALFSLWLLVLLATPSVISFFGVPAVSIAVSVSIAVLLLAIGSVVLTVWPLAKVVQVSLLVVVISLGFEGIGVNTGLLFGRYHYTDLFPFHIFGVPLLIPFAWLSMLFPVWGVASLILGRSQDHVSMAFRLRFSALSGLILLCWDFYVDPQMVNFGAWVWESPSGYFGTPWLNFVGWWVTGFVATFLARPDRLPETPMLMIYTSTWILQVVALGAIWGHPLAALCGFITMGCFVVLGWINWKERLFPAAWKSFLQKS